MINITLDLSYLQEMNDDELFVELGDAQFDWEVTSDYENVKELNIVHAAAKILIARGWKLGDHQDVQMVPLSNEILNQIGI